MLIFNYLFSISYKRSRLTEVRMYNYRWISKAIIFFKNQLWFRSFLQRLRIPSVFYVINVGFFLEHCLRLIRVENLRKNKQERVDVIWLKGTSVQ